MTQTIKELLEEEYQKTMKEVSLAQTGTDEAKWALQKLTELHKQIMDETNTDNKSFMDMQNLSLEEKEVALKEEQAKKDKVLSIIKIAVDGVAIVLPIWASWTWMARGLQFEKTGTFTSRTGSWMSNHLRLFKK